LKDALEGDLLRGSRLDLSSASVADETNTLAFAVVIEAEEAGDTLELVREELRPVVESVGVDPGSVRCAGPAYLLNEQLPARV
jgi:hypothetical protein